MTEFARIVQPLNESVFPYTPNSVEKKNLKSELSTQIHQTIDIPLVINGERITTKNKFVVHSPHRRKLQLANCSTAEPKHIEAAINSSVSIQKEWSSMGLNERCAIFLKAADLITSKYRNKINAATMLGQSKTVYQSEIDAICELADFLRFNAFYAQRIAEEQPSSQSGIWNQLESRGLEGFVYAVAPFNFTAISVNLPCSPALMGCSVLWKPAGTAVLASYYAMEILLEAGLPPGVINFVPGDAVSMTSTALKHPEFAGLHFTGSTNTFNLLWQTISSNLDLYKNYPRIVGETGGKDFVFACPSADVDALRVALVRAAFEYQGQKCSAASRAYIPKSIWSKLKDAIVEDIKTIKMGDVADFRNFMGAVIDQKAFQRISDYINTAKQSTDSKILIGGNCDQSEGYFIEPTLVECSNPKAKTMSEEIFGPVLSLFIYDDAKIEETLDLVDQTSPYALTGAIFAKDRRDISKLTKRLKYSAGNFYINDKPTGAVVGQQPFGGARKSGTNDKAGSIYNLLRWTSHRTIKENFNPPTDYRYPHMSEE